MDTVVHGLSTEYAKAADDRNIQNPFQNSFEQLLAQLERVDLLIQKQLSYARNIYQSDNDFRGVVITESEIDTILSEPFGIPAWARYIQSTSPDFSLMYTDHFNLLVERTSISVISGVDIRLQKLVNMFGLSSFDLDVLLICMLSSIDVRYEKVFAFLQDDLSKKSPSVDLMLNILSNELVEKVKLRKCFDPDSNLFKYGLLEKINSDSPEDYMLLSDLIRINERISLWLLGNDEIDTTIRGFVSMMNDDGGVDNLLLDCSIKEKMSNISSLIKNTPALVQILGVDGLEKSEIANAISRDSGKKLIKFDFVSLSVSDPCKLPQLFTTLKREACLQEANIYCVNTSEFIGDKSNVRIFSRFAEDAEVTLFLSADDSLGIYKCQKKLSLQITLPPMSFHERTMVWARELKKKGLGHDNDTLTALSSRYRMNESQIASAAKSASEIGLYDENDTVSLEDVYDACRQDVNTQLRSLAQKISPCYDWKDIILPTDNMNNLREICAAISVRHKVFDDWGFAKKHSLGKGFNILFFGASGTGKTMASEVIANELSLDLYKVDMSQIVSKYIGETEKNIDKIFKAAKNDNSILFFDEADAIFGKRSEVKDAHDRYANIETGYLLQKMEEHEGVVILSSNLKNNIDTAFMRRMFAVLEFPFPDEVHRRKIWISAIPAQVPIEKDLDLDFLARNFRLSGGNIKNVVLRAAFLSVSGNGVLSMENLVKAIQREYQKINRPCTNEDFGQYYEMVS